MTSKASIGLALFVVTCFISTTFAASPWSAFKASPSGDKEKISIREDGPSMLTSRVVLATGDSANEQDTTDSWDDRRIVTRSEGNGGLGGFLGTVLKIRETMATGIEGLLNGVVGGILGGARPADDGAAR